MEGIANFTRNIIAAEENKDIEFDIDDLVDDVLGGKVAVDQLPQVAQNTAELQRKAKKIYEAVPGKSRTTHLGMSELFRPPLVLTDFSETSALLDAGIYPSPVLRDFLRQRGEGALDLLEQLRQRTERGQFDPNNLAQRDLEYLKYLDLAIAHGITMSHYDNFIKLPFVRSVEREVKTLTGPERMEAEAATLEAANLYWFIQGKVDLGRKVAVIGNQRYGAYFIAEPLRPFLDDIGVSVYNNYYIRSSGNKDEDLTKELTRLQGLLASRRFDDVIIVDGTPNPYQLETPRLPSALGTYAKWLEENSGHHGYNLAHWVPQPGDEIVYGNQHRVYVPSANSSPEVILANPVIHPDKFGNYPRALKNHKTGYFDDPDRHSKTTQEGVFTEKGVEILSFGRTEEEIVNLVQSHMISVMPRYQRLAAQLRQDI